MKAARQRPILWDLYEEHLSEAAFLWETWEASLQAANYALHDVVVGPEARLAAHLDALVLGGPHVAEKLLLPALDGDEVELCSPVAWALLQSEDGDHFDTVLGALAGAEPPKAAAIARAMALSRHPAIVQRLSAFWAHGAPTLRAVILEVLARHDFAWVAARVPEALRASEPALFAVALGLARRLPARDPGLTVYVDQGLGSSDPQVISEAIATGLLLGNRGIWKACYRAVEPPGVDRLPFALLGLSTEEKDRERLRACLKEKATVRHAIWALGFAGDVESADALIPLLADEKLGPMAGEAFSTITGLAIDGRYRAAGETKGPDEEEVSVDDPPPEVKPEDHLLVPAPEAVAAWWQKNRARFHPRMRYMAGGPRVPEALRAAMRSAPMWRRDILALEIAAGAGSPVEDLRGWAREQLAGPAPPVPVRARR